jgi:hypothetical protein
MHFHKRFQSPGGCHIKTLPGTFSHPSRALLPRTPTFACFPAVLGPPWSVSLSPTRCKPTNPSSDAMGARHARVLALTAGAYTQQTAQTKTIRWQDPRIPTAIQSAPHSTQRSPNDAAAAGKLQLTLRCRAKITLFLKRFTLLCCIEPYCKRQWTSWKSLQDTRAMK